MTGRVVLATRNAHKVIELQRILSAAGLDVELVGLDAFPGAPDVAETESSFAGNALLKARSIAEFTGLPAIADDSGLCVDALNGMPGIYSARWSGRHGDDHANLELVLGQVVDVPDGRRGAQFVCAAAWVVPGESEHVVEGVLEGSLAREPRGSNGFGYDPIFIPQGYALTTAELRPEEKDAISHRGQAFRVLAREMASS
ncbi:MAG: RdgB/HAM1 family non-canonical purine NTP pyrophosphatase [Candidatus Nanopelagicales bacterium]